MIPAKKEWFDKIKEALFSALPIAVLIVVFFLVTKYALPEDYFHGVDV